MTSTLWTAVVALSAVGFIAAAPGAPPARVVGSSPIPAAGGRPDTLVANPGATSIRLKGTGLGGRGAREGTVKLASGLFVIRHEKLTSGTFTIDMRSLDAALRVPALFDAERHPTALFRSSGAERVGPARWRVAGDLTMRGVTRPVSFETDVAWPELGHMVATSTFSIDRRQWGVGGGGSGVASSLVDDQIQIILSLDARRRQASVATR